MSPFFSIIIPVYNVAPYLRECLDSVIAQTFTDWEAICVDDGSTDNSGAVLAEYADKDSRIKVVKQINSGVVAARMTGFCNSCGDWVLFLDGDDELRSGCLSGLLGVLSMCRAEMVQFGYEWVENSGTRSLQLPLASGEKTFDWVIANSVKSPLDTLGMCVGDKCYRRDLVEKVFDEIGCVRITHSEDGLFAFAALLHVSNIMFVQEAFYQYNIRQGSASHKINKTIVSDKAVFLKKVNHLAVRSKRMTGQQIAKMLQFHSYQACCYIFLMLARNNPTMKDVFDILHELKATDYFLMKNAEVNSFKRRFVYALLQHPVMFLVVQKCGFLG